MQYHCPSSWQYKVCGPKINFSVQSLFEYQNIKCERYFDIANLSSYDVILGDTLVISTSSLPLVFNSSRVVIGSDAPCALEGPAVSILESRAAAIYDESLAEYRSMLTDVRTTIVQEGGGRHLSRLCVL